MNCWAQIDLEECVDGELPAAEEAFVEAHLHGCADCRRRPARLRETSRRVRALSGGVLSERFATDLLERLRDEARPAFGRRDTLSAA